MTRRQKYREFLKSKFWKRIKSTVIPFILFSMRLKRSFQ